MLHRVRDFVREEVFPIRAVEALAGADMNLLPNGDGTRVVLLCERRPFGSSVYRHAAEVDAGRVLDLPPRLIRHWDAATCSGGFHAHERSVWLRWCRSTRRFGGCILHAVTLRCACTAIEALHLCADTPAFLACQVIVGRSAHR